MHTKYFVHICISTSTNAISYSFVIMRDALICSEMKTIIMKIYNFHIYIPKFRLKYIMIYNH